MFVSLVETKCTEGPWWRNSHCKFLKKPIIQTNRQTNSNKEDSACRRWGEEWIQHSRWKLIYNFHREVAWCSWEQWSFDSSLGGLQKNTKIQYWVKQISKNLILILPYYFFLFLSTAQETSLCELAFQLERTQHLSICWKGKWFLNQIMTMAFNQQYFLWYE